MMLITLRLHLDDHAPFRPSAQHRIDRRQMIIEPNIHHAAAHRDHHAEIRYSRFVFGARQLRDTGYHLMLFPSRPCIRRAAPPGCTVLDEPELVALPTRWPSNLSKSPKPVAGWRAQTK